MRTFGFFSVRRFLAIARKEFIQVRRDAMTFRMMVGIPLMQLILFGFAVNADPKNLPAAVIVEDQSAAARSVLYAIKNSGYFKFVRELTTEAEGRDALRRGEVQFVVNIPPSFSRTLLRGERPELLVEGDATDPAVTSNAIGSLKSVVTGVLRSEVKGALSYLNREEEVIDLRVHALYNPEAITHNNIVPGLMGVVLTMTLVIITGLAITRELESGTMETLLSMPTKPLEVLVGKIIPYILVGYIQVVLIIIAARYLFGVPIVGSLPLLFAATLIFIAANLSVGIMFSTIAQNQRQAMQLSMFFFLPSILLSGFIFPFRGMPVWAQYLGEVLPLTHFLRIVRGIMLKGIGPFDILPQLWPIALFTAIVITIGVSRYRQTLD